MESIKLNPTTQKELYERAVRRMAELLPGWSDAIPSDPAVTVLELLTGLSDAQNQRIDEVRREHLLAYLKLLGEGHMALAPARLRAARPKSETKLFPNMRFWIDGMPFEVEDGWQSVRNWVARTVLEPGDGRQPPHPGGLLRLSQENWERLIITFAEPLPAGSPVRLWCEIVPEPGRTPPEETTPAPFRLKGAVWDSGAERWDETPVQDSTCGFLHSGWLEWTPAVVSSRLCLAADGQVEGTPVLAALVLEPVTLVQRQTRSITMDLTAPFPFPNDWVGERVLRFFLPAGDGVWREAPGLSVQRGRVCGYGETVPEVIRVAAAEPDFSNLYPLRALPLERVTLEERGVLRDSLQVMVEEEGRWYDCPVCVPEPDRTLERGCRWDDEAQALCFGDGRDFRVPKRGRALVCGCACTMGAAGNGAGGVLEGGGIRMFALGTAGGGQDSEDPQSAYLRVAKEQAEPLRAVTCADYAKLARRTPGLALDRVAALPGGGPGESGAGIRLFVLPRSDRPLPALTAWQKERLTQLMERCRLIGVPVTVQSPRYLPIQVSVTLRAAGQVWEEELRTIALRLVDGVRGQADFGAELSHPALYAALSAANGVLSIQTLELRPMGWGAKRTQGGSWILDGDMLPYLQTFQLKQV